MGVFRHKRFKDGEAWLKRQCKECREEDQNDLFFFFSSCAFGGGPAHQPQTLSQSSGMKADYLSEVQPPRAAERRGRGVLMYPLVVAITFR